MPIRLIRSSRSPLSRLLARLDGVIPAERLLRDPLHTLAYAGDASLYRLIPKLVVKAAGEAETAAVLAACHELRIPVTFRAAGTSLSGQALSDSVLLVCARSFNRCEALDGGARIRMQPALIGGAANRVLAPYGRKLGPDPASIDAAMIGGIAANNASGMCCGVAQNCYQTLESLRMVCADGTVLDTADTDSRAAFARGHGDLLAGLERLAAAAQADATLRDLITRKHRIKNTVGYGLNALIDFSDPFDILAHLLIGSEGTLGFISSLTLRTIADPPCRAAVFARFQNGGAAAKAVQALAGAPVQAVEYLDEACLRSVARHPEIAAGKGTGHPGPALLIDVRADSAADLRRNLAQIESRLRDRVCIPIRIADRPETYRALWAIRKGLLPAIGSLRPTGTALIIEDVAFPPDRLAEGLADLRALLDGHGYAEACIYGHALAGNLHFVFWQDLAATSEVQRYAAFLDGLAALVVDKHRGSLKAEHGTGRNMAPFVEREWGARAYGMMKEIKRLFDPAGILNPDVILSGDPRVHLRNFKALPAADPLIDKCSECGFCESVCPSRDTTLTPRQRISVLREISRGPDAGFRARARWRALRKGFAYSGIATCAADSLCAVKCPVGIDTGAMVKSLRARSRGRWGNLAADFIADRFDKTLTALRFALACNQAARGLFGEPRWSGFLRGLARLLPRAIPAGLEYLPRPAPARALSRAETPPLPASDRSNQPRVLYIPACLNRIFGPERREDRCLPGAMAELLHRAGFAVETPIGIDGFCCGLAFTSKGFAPQGDRKLRELRAAIAAQSAGCLAIVCDASPCSQRLLADPPPGPPIRDCAEFLAGEVLSRLDILRRKESIALHPVCSAAKMAQGDSLRELASACAVKAHIPESAACCGAAGDKLFTHPELSRSANMPLRATLPAGCREGYAGSRACEIALSRFGGVPFRSFAYLLLECSEPPHFNKESP